MSQTDTDKGNDPITRQLLERRSQLAHRAHRIESDLRRELEPPGADSREQTTQRENDEVLERIRSSATDELQHIDAALRRLRLGVYGTCERCHQGIEPERLRAVPYAVRCARCADDGMARQE